MIKRFRNRFFPLTKNEERALILKYEKNRDEKIKTEIVCHLEQNYNIAIEKGKTRQLIEEIVARVSSGHLNTFHDIEEYFTEINKHKKEHVVSALAVLANSNILDYNCRLTSEYSLEHFRMMENVNIK